MIRLFCLISNHRKLDSYLRLYFITTVSKYYSYAGISSSSRETILIITSHIDGIIKTNIILPLHHQKKKTYFSLFIVSLCSACFALRLYI